MSASATPLGMHPATAALGKFEPTSQNDSSPVRACRKGIDTMSANRYDENAYYGDLQRVARDLTPTEAHILCGYLKAAGIPAEVGDTNMLQMNTLLGVAMGGANVRVPEAFMPEALQVMDAFQRGEFQLDEDFDGEAV